MSHLSLPRALARDPVLGVVLLLFLAIAVSSYLGALPAAGGLRGGFETLLAALLTIVAIEHRLRRSETKTGIVFWRYVAAALGLWLLGIALGKLLPDRSAAALSVDGIYVTYYLVLVLAAELRPDLGPVARPRGRSERLLLANAVFFVLGLFVYCAVIPFSTDRQHYLHRELSTLLYLFLEFFLLARFAYLSRVTASPRWRLTYRFFFGASVVSVALLGFEFYTLSASASASSTSGGRWWPLPLLVIVAAARLGRLAYPDEPDETEGPRVWEPLAFYAFALPLFHILLDYYGRLSPESQRVQEGAVILYFVAMGVHALGHSARREGRRREFEEALRESERRYRRLIESHPDAILVEQNGALVYANATAIDKLDIKPPIEGLSLAVLGFPEEPPSAAVGSERPKKMAIPVDCQLPGIDSERIDLEVAYYDAVYRGAPARQVIARDVTDVKRFRAEAEATARLASLGKISAAMAHEIRNPLAALVMHCFFLAERMQIDDENQQILADINAAVDRMQKLVNGILGFVRPSALVLVDEDLIDVVESGLSALTRQTDSSKVEIVRDYRHKSATVQIDVNQMVDVFINIFDNAVRAMPDGGRITIRAKNPSTDAIEVMIEDSGLGIGEEELAQIFEPFFTRRDDGIGLGLALVARILGQHPCRYRVESQLKVGTRFTLAFDLATKRPEPSGVIKL